MSKKLIDAEETIRNIIIAAPREPDEAIRATASAIVVIENMPSAQPERKRGKWILTDFPDEQTYECSACNEIWTFITGTPIDNGAYFCPNCGADMRGESDGCNNYN